MKSMVLTLSLLITAILVSRPGHAQTPSWWEGAREVRFAPERPLVALLLADDTIRVQYTTDPAGPPIFEARFPGITPERFDFDGSGRMLVVRDADSTRIIGLAGGVSSRTLGPGNVIADTCKDQDLMVVMNGGRATLTKLGSGEFLRSVPVPAERSLDNPLTYARFLDQCRKLILVETRNMYLHDAQTGHYLTMYSLHPTPIVHLAISDAARAFAAVDSTGFMRLVDLDRGPSGDGQVTLPWAPAAWDKVIGFSPDGQYLAFHDSASSLAVWRRAGDTWSPLGAVRHTDRIWSFAWVPGSNSIITGSRDQTARLTRLPELGSELLSLPSEHYGYVWSVAASTDGKHLAVGSYSGHAYVLDAATRSVVVSSAKFPTMSQSPPGLVVSFSADGRFLKMEEDRRFLGILRVP